MIAAAPTQTCTARIDSGRGSLVCVNDKPHRGDGHGCVFLGSDAPDRHSLTEGTHS